MADRFTAALHAVLDRWKGILGSIAALLIIGLQIVQLVEASGAHHFLEYAFGSKAQQLVEKSDRLATLIQQNGQEVEQHTTQEIEQHNAKDDTRVRLILDQLVQMKAEIKALEERK